MTSSSSSHAGARLASTRDPDMRQSNTIDELVQVAHDHLDTISPRGMAAFWPSLAKLVQNQRGGNSRVQLDEQLDAILDSTLESIGQFSGRDLATTALGLAKVMKQVESHGQIATTGSLHRVLHNLLVGINSEKKQFILNKVAKTSAPILSELDARHLSNLIYSFGHAECTPKIEDGRTIFDVLALEAMPKLQQFKPQELSNMLWSYTKMESSNSVLFKAAGDSIMGMNDVGEFKPQELSNIIWSYSTAGESHPQLYKKLGDHIVAMKDLGQFMPQALSNIIWAFATAGESHPKLFSKFGDHIVAMKNLGRFLPQHYSNILWSYATSGEAHPRLYSKLGDHIVAMKDLGLFKPQELSNIVWAYATVGIIDPHLFTSFAPAVKSVSGQYNSQALANIAWAYAVANVNDPSLFNTDFVDTLQSKANDFDSKVYSQLHQWQLWQDELKSGIR